MSCTWHGDSLSRTIFSQRHQWPWGLRARCCCDEFWALSLRSACLDHFPVCRSIIESCTFQVIWALRPMWLLLRHSSYHHFLWCHLMTYKSKNIHMCNSEIIWGRPTDGLMDMTSFRDAWPKICIPPIFYFCFSNGQTERHTILLRWENENWSWLILISDLSRGALYGWKFILQRCLTFFNRQKNKDCFDAVAEVYISPFFLCLWLDSSIQEDGGQKGDIQAVDVKRPFSILLLQFVVLSFA